MHTTPEGAGQAPFIAMISEPVSVRVPAAMHPSGQLTVVPVTQLTEDVMEHGPMGITFEGPTF